MSKSMGAFGLSNNLKKSLTKDSQQSVANSYKNIQKKSGIGASSSLGGNQEEEEEDDDDEDDDDDDDESESYSQSKSLSVSQSKIQQIKKLINKYKSVV